jgi:prepilin-type N-terminal cleavage/methylation domain-containing protein
MSRRGVTLVELLITVIIGSIAFFALSVPFVTERSIWVAGKAQTEAQRDAQLVFRSIARQARQSSGYTLNSLESITLDVTDCDGDPLTDDSGTMTFERHAAGEFHWHDCDGNTIVLIDGVTSQVTSFTVQGLSADRIALAIDVLHNNRENEVLATEIFLRNAS